jgi:hypothetical protein
MAKRILGRNPSVSNIKISDSAKGHVLKHLHPDEYILAKLGSCAIRLCTVCEIKKGEFKRKDNYRNKFYDRNSNPRYCRKKGYTQAKVITKITQNLDEHIQFLLRDNVAHEENADSHMAKDRSKILLNLTVGETLSAINSCMEKIVKKIS